MPFEPIENYGVIGNMQSIALVGIDGSIDFLCYPNFDSPTIFAALLDDRKGGRFEISPQLANARVRQMYLPETNILITRFLADEGVAELTDYMPIDSDGGEPNEIVRKVAVIRGDVRFQMCCGPRFPYQLVGIDSNFPKHVQRSTRFPTIARQCRYTRQSASGSGRTISPRISG